MEVIVGVWDIVTTATHNAPEVNAEPDIGGLQITGVELEPSPASPQVSTDPSTINLPSTPTHNPSSTPHLSNPPTTGPQMPTPIEVRDKVHRQLNDLGAKLAAHARYEVQKRVSAGTLVVFDAVVEKFNSKPFSHWENKRDGHANAFRYMMIKVMARGFDVRLGELSRVGDSLRVGNLFSVHKRYADATALVEQDVAVFDELTQAWRLYSDGVNTLAVVGAASEIAAAKAAAAEAAAEEGKGE